MKQKLEQYQQLKRLYTLRAFGQYYIDNRPVDNVGSKSFDAMEDGFESLYQKVLHCRLCARSKIREPVFGIINPEANIVFATLTPITNEKNQFLSSRSAKILQDIIRNIFAFSSKHYGILSLLKCAESFVKKDDFLQCQPYFFQQIAMMPRAIILCFGGEEILDFFMLRDKNLFGRLIEFQQRRFLITYSLLDLLKNPSLKKETMQHLLLIKEAL